MMKKLLIMAMLLGIASVASAALMLDVEVDGVDYAGQVLNLNTEVTVKVIQLAENTDGVGGNISINIGGTGLTFTNGALANVWGYGLVGTQGFVGNQAYYQTSVDAGAGTPGVGSSATVPIPVFPFEYTTDYDFTFMFTYTATVDHILMIGGEWDGELSAVCEFVDVLPEPMTMALLGLGGLFLRRRR